MLFNLPDPITTLVELIKILRKDIKKKLPDEAITYLVILLVSATVILSAQVLVTILLLSVMEH